MYNNNIQSHDDFLKTLPYVPRNVFAVLTRNLTVSSAGINLAIKELIEVKLKEVSGLSTSFGYNEDTKKVEYENSNPTLVFPEVQGRATTRALEEWLESQIKHGLDAGLGIDVMFIETDATGKIVVDAWHCKEMKFTFVHGHEGKRNLDEIDRDADISIGVEFTSKTERGRETRHDAQSLLNEINVSCSNPHIGRDEKTQANKALANVLKQSEQGSTGYEEAAKELHDNIRTSEYAVLEQLVKEGPVGDGYVISKTYRDNLIELGLADKVCVKGEQGFTGANYIGWDVFYAHGKNKEQ